MYDVCTSIAHLQLREKQWVVHKHEKTKIKTSNDLKKKKQRQNQKPFGWNFNNRKTVGCNGEW